MRAGVSVITPNKKAGSGPLARYKAIKAQERQSFQHFFYEARPMLPLQLPFPTCISATRRLLAALGADWTCAHMQTSVPTTISSQPPHTRRKPMMITFTVCLTSTERKHHLSPTEVSQPPT